MARRNTDRARVVTFEDTNQYSRLPRDDELSVMKHFARHAAKCNACYDPYRTYKASAELCSEGHRLARDVAKYVYYRDGLPIAQVDRLQGDIVEIEIPSQCEVVRSLIKAIDRGILHNKTRSNLKPVIVSEDPSYYVSSRPQKKYYDRDSRANMIEIVPGRSERRRERFSPHDDQENRSPRRDRETKYSPRGSLYWDDEAEKRASRKISETPIIMYAEPRKSSGSSRRRP